MMILRTALLLAAAHAALPAIAGPVPNHSHNSQPICHKVADCPYRTNVAQTPVHSHVQRPPHRHVTVTPGRAVKPAVQIHMINAPHHRAAGVSLERGVRVYRPAGNANLPQAAARSRAEQAARQEADQRARQNRSLAQQNAALAASLDAIAANQKAILAQTARANRPVRRRVYYGNNRFFGRNGFIGNRNFAGATVPTNRRRGDRRRSKKLNDKAH